MVQVFRYISPGSWSVDLGNTAVRLGKIPGWVTNAELGSPGISNIVIDNPTLTVGHSSDNIVGWKQFAVDELAETAGDQRIYFGLVGDRTYRRGQGDDSSLRVTTGGEIEATISDLNEYLSLHIVTGTDGNRQAETVDTRLTWLLASTYLTGLVYDNGFVATNTTSMDAVDYRGQKPMDILGDLATVAHYNFFVYYDESAAQASLWFDDSNTSANWDSGCFISNVLADINDTAIKAGTASVFYPYDDARLVRSPVAVYSGAYVPYAKGNSYQTNATTATNFIARDGSAPNANLKTLAAANAVGTLFLTDSSTEDDRITCTIWVAAAQANAIKAGQLVQVKFSHLPGYTAYKFMRVMNRALAQTDTSAEFYLLTLELSPTDITVSVVEYTTATILSDYVPAIWDSLPGSGRLGISMLALRATTAPTAYAKSTDSDVLGASYITGTEYTNLANTGFADGYGFTMSSRYPTTADDSLYLRWSPTGSLGGSSRPRSHSVIIAGATTIGTPVADGVTAGTMSATPSSATVHADGPGIIVYGMLYNYPGPGDHVGWGGFTVTATSGVLLGSGYGTGAFAPFSWMAYLLVSAAGNYQISFSLTPPTGEGDPLSSYNCSRLGVWVG